MIAFDGVGVVFWARVHVCCGDASLLACGSVGVGMSVCMCTGPNCQRVGAQVAVRACGRCLPLGTCVYLCIVDEALQSDPFLVCCVCST
jgi:hypothetical protein